MFLSPYSFSFYLRKRNQIGKIMSKYPPVHYSDYLKVDQILSAQSPKSDEYGKHAHDEMLFIIIHQVYELWFKQILHEMDSVIEMFKNETVDEINIGIAVSRLDRIVEIQKVLIDQIKILETMTPLDFLDFRNFLIPASGFQSFQFRLIENKMGLKPDQRLDYNQHPYHTRFPKDQQEILLNLEKENSLFQLVEKWLERTPFLDFRSFNFMKVYKESVQKMLESDKEIIETNPVFMEDEKKMQLQMLSLTHENFNSVFDETIHNQLMKDGQRRLSYKATVAALFINLYRDEPILHLPYKLLSTLVEIDENFNLWRYRHSLMVLRMIGKKIGTGGSSGHHYLKSTAEKYKIFDDLFNLSTFLIPRTELPKLSSELKEMLGFYYSFKG